MTAMTPRELPLPENCRVRLVDLPVEAGGMIAVDETGFVNIYLNARLSRQAQREALQHELRHHYRGDLYSDEDIRDVERAADGPGIVTLGGSPVAANAAAFDPGELRRVGKGLYLPTGDNLARAAAHIDALRQLLLEACRVYDVMQDPPVLSRGALEDLAGSLGAGDIAFVAWHDAAEACPAVLHFSREDLYGAIYYAPDGAPDNALAVMVVGEIRLTVDVRRRGARLDVCGITRSAGGRTVRIY